MKGISDEDTDTEESSDEETNMEDTSEEETSDIGDDIGDDDDARDDGDGGDVGDAGDDGGEDRIGEILVMYIDKVPLGLPEEVPEPVQPDVSLAEMSRGL